MAQKITRFDMYCDLAGRLGYAEGVRMDANETAYFARQLESIDKKLYERRYPEFKGTQIVPIMSGVDEGAEEYTYRSITEYGISAPDRQLRRQDQARRRAGRGGDLQDLRPRARLRLHHPGHAPRPHDGPAARRVARARRPPRDRVAQRRGAGRGLQHGPGIKGFYNNASVELVVAHHRDVVERDR
jgi:hypothetical protein